MEWIILSFIAIAIMRVAQKVCSKKVSNAVSGKAYFHYGGNQGKRGYIYRITGGQLFVYGFDL